MVLEGTLRPIGRDDLATRVAWLRNKVVQDGLNLSGEISFSSTADWFERVGDDVSRADMVLELNGGVAAMGGLTGIDPDVASAELYAFVDPARAGRGLGTLLIAHLCRLGFVDCQLDRIYLWMFGGNVAASRLYRKAGFSLEGVLRQHSIKNGIRVDRHVMGLMRSEWKDGVEGADS